LEWLEDEGMGVVGYTYDQVQNMPMVAVSRAIVARKKLIGDVLKGIFGEAEPETPKVSERPLTPALFKAVLGKA
jgi:hypothetical protein